MAKTYFSAVNFSEHSEFPEKRQLEKFLRNFSSLQSFLFQIYVITIAKVRNVYFSRDFTE